MPSIDAGHGMPCPYGNPLIMAKNDLTKSTLAQLGADTPDKIAANFATLQQTFDGEAAQSQNPDAWKIFVARWTGRKSGALTEITENWLKPAPPELKKVIGQELNKLKAHVEALIEEKRREMELAEEQAAAARNRIDLSLPGVKRTIGSSHVIQQTFEELQRIFLSIGFSVVEGPEIETPYYNFEALNIPEHHPARDNMDTFYIEGARSPHLLRTHTSPMQIRAMEKQKPPVRIVVPGKVYRRDNPDSTHGYMFHQIEGLAVDTDITFCDFKGTVEYFVRAFLGPKVKTRLRPSFFPFTEPSAEVDASCHVCGGSGCRVCKHSGWIELFGAGMVNPAVYGFVNYDPERLSGFAFGMGVDRFAMMKYGVPEVPLLFQNDVRFLRQFS
ncbi:MAG TPA: phenylalanine--tRNA ligase subunit alpha [Candidatus Acidoferrum sp.]|nr:phenylalanine--tRNA ligase subunit alpha [Candidatus Acidoferrum sp.]